MAFIILLAVLAVLAYRITSPEDRLRYLGIALDRIRRLKSAAAESAPEREFRESLRARTRHALVTPALVAINVMVVAAMVFGAGAIGAPDTLVAWGASLGTRTTNGEWWRLVTSAFVHTGTVHLLVDAAVLVQIGLVLERLLGRLALAGVYVSAGAFAGLVNLSSRPVAVTSGASAAIFGLYGLLLVSVMWQLLSLRREGSPETEESASDESGASAATMPLMTMKRIGAGAAVFLVYSALSGFVHTPELTGLLVGAIYGLVLGRSARSEEAGTHRVAGVMVAAAAIAVACAVPMRHIANVKPEIVRVLATEERTTATYRTASDAFTRGRLTADALAQLIERAIASELQAADARLAALENVPREQQPLVTDARDYLRLRRASWQARADAIRKTNPDPRAASRAAADTSSRLQAEARFRSNLAVLGNAEGAERAAHAAFQKMRNAL